MENETNSCDKQEIFKKNYNEKKLKVNNPLCPCSSLLKFTDNINSIKTPPNSSLLKFTDNINSIKTPPNSSLLKFTDNINSIKTPPNSCLSSPITNNIINSKYLLNIEYYNLPGTVDFSLLDVDINLHK
jgi:hypothetical protein